MRIKILAAIFLSVMLAPLGASAQGQAPSAKPNVVLIITDDVGYGDLGSYGAPDVKTPNIDRIGREGTRFTDFYAAPTCSPTRALLLTGRYYQRVKIEQPMGGPRSADGERGLPVTGRTLPQLLKNNGYATGLIGKWHLGYKPEFSPNAHGFDYFWGFKSGFVDYYQHTDGGGNRDLYENGDPAHATGYLTDLITERSVKFIEERAGSPFFLEVAYNAAHWPFQVPDKPSVAAGNARFVQPQDAETGTRQDYVAILERADQGVGKILAALDKHGLSRDTIVIYTQDNGGEWLSRNAPFFHRKGSVWEGGVRVPLVVRWPGRVPARRTTPQVGMMFDLLPTLLAATGGSVPAEARLDGVNLLPVLEGRAQPIERTLFFRNVVPARAQRAVRRGDWKVLADGAAVMVFNLRDDPGERNDLARTRQDLARQLRPLIAEWEKGVDAP